MPPDPPGKSFLGMSEGLEGNLKPLGYGGSIDASPKLKGIDGKAHQEWNLRLNLTQHGETYWVRT